MLPYLSVLAPGYKPLAVHKFAAAWLPALVVSTTLDPAPRLADAFTFQIGGIGVPPVTCVLAALGIALARPLVRKREASLGLPGFLLVTAILLITVELWIIDSRPGALFAFVIAIGAGFSGYSLIELAGDQARDLLQRLLSRNPEKPSDSGAQE